MHASSLFSWEPQSTPSSLHCLLDALSEEYPLSRYSGNRSGDTKLLFVQAPDPNVLKVTCNEKETTIVYGSPAAAARGIGHALAGQSIQGTGNFATVGIMLDCSRNAVMKVDYLKRWLRRLALMGYNQLMLYTEDTYALPGEPYFGYQRGRYSAGEIREVDAYARRLGIEVVACIQTLGHMEQILKWDAYREISDASNSFPYVLLVDEEKTYALIEKMLDFWSENLQSRRIHLGMDEAHELGRGKFLDRHGWEPPFDIFNRHLSRVTQMCAQKELRPMIWSDMYFRMGSKTGDYYDRDAVIPEAVKEKIPSDLELVYWDYYHKEEEFYTESIRRHRELGHEPFMASGIWTWARFWYDHKITVSTVLPCVEACRKAGLREITFTMWADATAYCEFDSAFAGLAFAADLCYGGKGETAQLAPFVKAIGAGDYASMVWGSDLENAGTDEAALSASTFLWDDPLFGIGHQGYAAAGVDFWDGVEARLQALYEKVTPLKNHTTAPDYHYLWCLTHVALLKLRFRKALVATYQKKDKDKLNMLREQSIPPILEAYEEWATAFRRQWLRRNKPQGMESTQIRIGAGATRFRETALRLKEFCEGEIETIEELDASFDAPTLNPVRYFAWLSSGSVRI